MRFEFVLLTWLHDASADQDDCGYVSHTQYFSIESATTADRQLFTTSADAGVAAFPAVH